MFFFFFLANAIPMTNATMTPPKPSIYNYRISYRYNRPHCCTICYNICHTTSTTLVPTPTLTTAPTMGLADDFLRLSTYLCVCDMSSFPEISPLQKQTQLYPMNVTTSSNLPINTVKLFHTQHEGAFLTISLTSV